MGAESRKGLGDEWGQGLNDVGQCAHEPSLPHAPESESPPFFACFHTKTSSPQTRSNEAIANQRLLPRRTAASSTSLENLNHIY